MQINFNKIPDWVATLILGLVTAILGMAVAWGQLRSEVSAQVTAQGVDSADIKQLIIGQASLQETVKDISDDVKQIHQDNLAVMNAYGLSGNHSPLHSASGTRRH